jgi:hypothetical protein
MSVNSKNEAAQPQDNRRVHGLPGVTLSLMNALALSLRAGRS